MTSAHRGRRDPAGYTRRMLDLLLFGFLVVGPLAVLATVAVLWIIEEIRDPQ